MTNSTAPKISHAAMFANPADRVAIQSTGTDAEGAIAAAVQATGLTADAFVAVPVTPRMSVLLMSGAAPTSWVDREDGKMDCEIDYAVFDSTKIVWDEDTGKQELAYVNLIGSDIEADSAYDAAIEAVDEAGYDREGYHCVVISYPRNYAFDELFEECGETKWCLREGFDARMVNIESIDLVDQDDEDYEFGEVVTESTVDWAIEDSGYYDIYALRDVESGEIEFEAMQKGLQPNWKDSWEELGCARAHLVDNAAQASAPKKAMHQLLLNLTN